MSGQETEQPGSKHKTEDECDVCRRHRGTRSEQTAHNPADPRDPPVKQQEKSRRSTDQGAAAERLEVEGPIDSHDILHRHRAPCAATRAKDAAPIDDATRGRGDVSAVSAARPSGPKMRCSASRRWRVCSSPSRHPSGVKTSLLSLVCSAVTSRRSSSTLRPTFIGYQVIARIIPAGSMTKVARTVALVCAPGCSMP